MMFSHSLEFSPVANALPATWPAWPKHRPNLLLISPDEILDRAVSFVLESCAPPFHFCSLPGTLLLPDTRTGTLLLWDVASLTAVQQSSLYDWIGSSRGNLQIVSMTSKRLDLMVRSGEFKDGLYYRLNVVRLTADDQFDRAASS
jgi:hypothetical protein